MPISSIWHAPLPPMPRQRQMACSPLPTLSKNRRTWGEQKHWTRFHTVLHGRDQTDTRGHGAGSSSLTLEQFWLGETIVLRWLTPFRPFTYILYLSRHNTRLISACLLPHFCPLPAAAAQIKLMRPGNPSPICGSRCEGSPLANDTCRRGPVRWSPSLLPAHAHIFSSHNCPPACEGGERQR